MKEPAVDYDVNGGESACYAHLLCPECATMLSEKHRPTCSTYDVTTMINDAALASARENEVPHHVFDTEPQHTVAVSKPHSL